MKTFPAFLISIALLLAGSAGVVAQTPVVWSLEREGTAPLKPGSTFTMLVKAEIEFGWHLYAVSQPPGGPIATEVRLLEAAPFASGGPLGTEKPSEGFDPNFNLVTEYYEDHTVFRVPVKIAPTAKDGRYTATINVRYQSCNDTLCIPPRSQTLKVALAIGNPAGLTDEAPVKQVVHCVTCPDRRSATLANDAGHCTIQAAASAPQVGRRQALAGAASAPAVGAAHTSPAR